MSETKNVSAILTIDQSAIDRVQSLREQRGINNLMLRVTVEGGGCSGFQYNLSLTETVTDDDHIFKDCVVTDDISVPLIAGSVVKFEESLVGAEFKVDNPNAVMGCGCGTSFAV